MSLRSLLVLLLCCGVLGGCTGNNTAEDAVVTLTVGVESSPTNLDPRVGSDATSARVHTLVYSGLLHRNERMELVPDLAAGEPVISEDGTAITVTIKPDVVFHDGSPCTAEDVVWTFMSIIGDELDTTKKAGFKLLDRVEAVDEQTVVFHLTGPSPAFMENLTQGIVPQHEPGSLNLKEQPVGTGPYQLTDWQADASLTFDRFDRFHGEPAKTERIVYRIIPNNTTRLLELQRGDIDLIVNNISADAFDSYKRMSGLKTMAEPGSNYKYIGFNLEDETVGNPLVRQAIAQAIDRDKIIEFLLGGYAAPADSPLPPSHWAHAQDLPQYTHDPDEAKKLLDQAGFPDPDGDGPKSRLEIEFKTSQDKTANKVAAIFQEQLRNVGIQLTIRSYEWATFYDDIVNGNFQMYSLKWVGISDPDFFYNTFHSSSVPPNGANRGLYDNPKVDELLEKARVELDRETRKGYYARVQQIIARDLPYISLWFDKNLAIMGKRVDGFVLYPNGGLDGLPRVTMR